MNLLAIIHIPPPLHGASITGKRIFKIIKKYYDVTLIRQSVKKNTNSKVKIFDLIYFFQRFLYTTKTIMLNKFDIVYITISTSGFIIFRDLLLITIIKFFHHKKLIIHFHSKLENKIIISLLNNLKNIEIISPSIEAAKPIKKKTHVLYGYVEEAEVKPIINKDQKKILFFSNIYKSKGIIEFLNIINEVSKKNNIIVNIWGNYLDFTKEDLLKIINSKKIQCEVNINGPLSEKEKYKLNENDILVFPSYYETFGISVIECMSLGIVPVVRKIGGLCEIVNPKNGYLVNNNIEFVEKINDLIENKKDFKEKSINCIETSKLFSINNFEFKVKKIFDIV